MVRKVDKRKLGRIVFASAALLVCILLGAWYLRDDSVLRHPVGATNAIEAAAGGPSRNSAAGGRDSNKVAPATVARALGPAALLPPGTPLAKIYDDLKARADGGDKEAASRLFTEAQRCFSARQEVRMLPRSANFFLDEDTSKLSAEELSQHEKHLANLEQRLAKVRAESALCEGLSDEQLQLAPLALQAAQLGNAAASDCYVSGILLYTGGLLDHPEWLAQYKNNAMTIAQAALERGDWRMVAALRDAYGVTLSIFPLGQLTGGDAVQYYRYLKLQQLGATDKNSAALDRQLADAAQSLTAVDQNAGDAWAQEMYLRFFSSTSAPADQNNMSACNL
jgi:hypothetical protein